MKAIYVFSGDPITYGHINVVKRAASVFDELIVGIGINPDKKYLFSLDERTLMAKKALANIPNVKVTSFEGLLIHYAYENDISVIVKGVRNSKDFDYENVLHELGESQKLGIDTHILFADSKLAHVSSSAVKAMQKDQGLIYEFVPIYVKQCLEEKISEQYVLGLTGEIASGKSFVGNKFEEIGKKKGLMVHNIDFDKIGHYILESDDELKYSKIREDLISCFGEKIRLVGDKINRKVLGDIVFNHESALQKLNEIMYNPVLVKLRRELYGKKGLIILNDALIAEAQRSYLCNNNVLILKVDKATQSRRLEKRSLTHHQIHRRLESQYNFFVKKRKIEEKISHDQNGQIWTLDRSDGVHGDEIEKIFDKIIFDMNINKN
ncbi:MAG: pantetheine-phosphate adenylyltransferase [Nanoarchaeota archaeon]|nr:pantetheine-phosphate adenylyltransferase [Nanoarchaeota archaeon]